MRAWKRILAFLLAFAMLLVCTVAVANENDTPPMNVPGGSEGGNDTPPMNVPDDEEGELPATSGTCGTDLAWEYANGVLTITGTGDMDSFDATSPAPWAPFIGDIVAVFLPDGLLGIGDAAFLNCEKLAAVTIPNSVTYIGERAFKDCEQLHTLTVGTSVYVIEDEAFSGCVALTDVALPNSMERIEESAFSGCEKLLTVSFGTKMETIEVNAFAGCDKLAAVTYGGTETTRASITIGDGNEKLTGAAWTCTGSSGGSGGGGGGGSLIIIIEPIETSGICGLDVTWEYADGVLTIACTNGPNDMDSYDETSPAPWAPLAAEIQTVVLGDGLLGIGDEAFRDCTALTAVEIPASCSQIGARAFKDCTALSSVTFNGETTYLIKDEAFAGCTALTVIDLGARVERVETGAFSGCSELVSVTFSKRMEKIAENVFAGCNKLAYVTYGGTEAERANIEIKSGNDKLTGASWTYNGTSGGSGGGQVVIIIDIDPIPDDGNKLVFAQESLPAGNTVEINGVPYEITDGKVSLPEGVTDGIVVEYTFHEGDPTDVHTQYPTSLKVWVIHEENGEYTAERVEDLDDILQYSGSSIRITGVKGIRMITSVPTDRKAILARAGIAGFKLKEYGTIVQWDSELNGAPLTLETPNVKRAYAYHRDDSGAVTDPVFKTVGGLTQYTNVLVGLTDEKCIPDLAMRPYMIVTDDDGTEYVIYGGTIHRSIGYIAYQNRAAFAPGSASYAYIWNIIHVVYGDQYDAEYRG